MLLSDQITVVSKQSQRIMENLIARLVRARQEKSMTLQDVSYKTNIRLEILTRIESGDTSFQPMPYIKAILRKYAETVGIKLHQSDFEEHTPTNENIKEEQPIQQPASPEPISVAVPSMPLNLEIPQPEQSHKKRLIYASLAGALIATLCVVWYLVKQTERISQDQVRSVSDQQVITKTLDTPAPVQESQPKQIAVTASESQRKPVIEDAEPTAKLEKKHVLVVRSKTDTCWISVASDKNSAKEILLTPSAVAKFNADSLFTLTVGKLETAELWLNGKPVTLPRRSGAISGFKLMPPKD
ncbi:MAG: helix-turn-helix domain-containing protein [Chlorobiales bacterium]